MINVTLKKEGQAGWFAGTFPNQEAVDAWVVSAMLDTNTTQVVQEVLPEPTVDPTFEAKKAAIALLASTDWMVIRQADSGVAVPREIKDQRAQARLTLNQ